MGNFYDYLFDKEIEPFRKFLRNKKYKSSDLKIPYRVIYHWSEQNIFIDNSTDSKWRRFSFTDIIWIEIIKELRKFGLSLEKISNIKEYIIDPPIADPHSFEYHVFLAIAQTPVSLLVYENGFGVFISKEHEFSNQFIKGKLNHNLKKSSFIAIDVNRLVSNIFPLVNDLPIFRSLVDLNIEEQELINFIRFNNFEEVIVKLKNGTLQRFEGKKRESLESNLIDILQKDDYQRIEVIQADSNIISIQRTVQKKPSKHGKKPA